MNILNKIKEEKEKLFLEIKINEKLLIILDKITTEDVIKEVEPPTSIVSIPRKLTLERKDFIDVNKEHIDIVLKDSYPKALSINEIHSGVKELGSDIAIFTLREKLKAMANSQRIKMHKTENPRGGHKLLSFSIV